MRERTSFWYRDPRIMRVSAYMRGQYWERFATVCDEYVTSSTEPDFSPDEWPLNAIFTVLRDTLDKYK